jgi:hypothetical protein
MTQITANLRAQIAAILRVLIFICVNQRIISVISVL